MSSTGHIEDIIIHQGRFLAIRVPGAVSVARVRAWQAAFLQAVHLQDSEDLCEKHLLAPTLVSCPSGSLPLESLEQDQSLKSMHGSLRSCRLCPYVTGNKALMKRHVRTHTGERPFKCHLCPNTFTQRWSLTRHVRSHMDERDYQCHLCPAAFSDGSNLKRFLAIRVPGAVSVARVRAWQAAFLLAVHLQDSEDLLEERLRAYTGSLPLESLEQDQSLESMHGSLRSCRLCPYVTGNKGHMKRHLRTHTGERPFKCHLCPNTFVQKCSLTRHVRSHMDERDYQCHLCPAAFSDGSNLKRHLNAFTHSSSLKRHMHSHAGERPVSCRHCGSLPLGSLEQDQLRVSTQGPNTFTQKPNLRRHVRSHTGERRYQCHLCPETFADSTTLKRHGLCHTGERPFRCVHCSASFKRRGNLNIHMSCHVGKEP
nr:zinc finger protein 782-like [Dermacentor andersoni]